MNHKATCMMTKAVRSNSREIPPHGLSWVGARRGRVCIHSDRLECGDWRIPFEDSDIDVLRWRAYGFLPCDMIRATHDDHTYFFGLNPWAQPLKHLPSETAVSTVSIRTSPMSVVARLAVIAYLVYFLAQCLF